MYECFVPVLISCMEMKKSVVYIIMLIKIFFEEISVGGATYFTEKW